jgi:hypothetical protein
MRRDHTDFGGKGQTGSESGGGGGNFGGGANGVVGSLSDCFALTTAAPTNASIRESGRDFG